MFWFVFVSVYIVLCHSTLLVTGRCLISIGTVSVSGSEESHLKSLEEHDHRLETKNQNMGSAFEKLEAGVSRTNARGQEELCHGLKTLYYNMSVNLDSLSEKIPERLECYTTQEHEVYLRFLNLSLTSMTVRTEEHIQKLSSALQTVNRSLDEKFQAMKVQLSSLINEGFVDVLRDLNQKLQTLSEALSFTIDISNEKLNDTLDCVKETNQSVEYQDPCRNTSIVCDCSDIKANGYTTSGVYLIYVVDEGQRYYANAFCDMTTTNGAWTVFQRRKDGSVDFYRDWYDYANGFGNSSGEFWLGNNFLHLLTSKRRYRLRIDLEDFEGEKRYAEYSTFNISSSADKYRLRIGTYSGTAGDSLTYHNGQRFSTNDNDNDAYTSANLAVMYHAAWWYLDGHSSNLNGLYLRGPYNLTSCSPTCYEGIEWYGWRGHAYSLKTTEMKIFPL